VPRIPADPAVHRVECGCGFAVEGNEDEVVDAARRHAETAHSIDLADGIVRALARPIAATRRTLPTRRNEPTGRQET
jgi:hypothetical protein